MKSRVGPDLHSQHPRFSLDTLFVQGQDTLGRVDWNLRACGSGSMIGTQMLAKVVDSDAVNVFLIAGNDCMTEQVAFNVYCYVVVGFLGNALIGWELGKKGWILLALGGPKYSRTALFALYCFILMMLWQMLRKLNSPFTSWRGLWIPGWGLLVLTVSHFLVPRSMRLYSHAKFLHETSYTGDWRSSESDRPTEQICTHSRLLKAESLYLKALQIQKRLSEESQNDMQYTHHQRNVAVTYSQLALLYIHQRQFEKASNMAHEAVLTAESLNDQTSNKSEMLSILSNALFRSAEIDQLQGKVNSAKVKYERSLTIDRNLQNDADAYITEARLNEITTKNSHGL